MRQHTDKVQVWDTRDFKLEGVEESVRPLVSPLVMSAMLERVSTHLSILRDHDLDIRRYYRVVEY